MTKTENNKTTFRDAAAEFLATKTTVELIDMFEALYSNYDARIAYEIERAIVKRHDIEDAFDDIFYADDFTGTALDAIKIALAQR